MARASCSTATGGWRRKSQGRWTGTRRCSRVFLEAGRAAEADGGSVGVSRGLKCFAGPHAVRCGALKPTAAFTPGRAWVPEVHLHVIFEPWRRRFLRCRQPCCSAKSWTLLTRAVPGGGEEGGASLGQPRLVCTASPLARSPRRHSPSGRGGWLTGHWGAAGCPLLNHVVTKVRRCWASVSAGAPDGAAAVLRQ